MRSTRRIRWAAIPVAAMLVLALSACTDQDLAGYMPGFISGESPVTNHTHLITDFWVNSWITLFAIGFITWVLMLWSMVVYRRRKTDTGLPVQLRYNMPIEILFTVIPFILIVGLFALTARDEAIIEKRFEKPEVTIQAFGKQWAWDFNYTNEDVYSSGIQVQPDKTEGAPQGSIDQATLPTLYLPVGKKVEIQLNARDVIHSFWVIDFLYKKDMIPGKTNYMSIIPEREGTYAGKCAELCGEFHSQMLFQVKVVSQAEYDAYIESLREQGFEGQLGNEYDRNLTQANVIASAAKSE